jgi:hypothetical protein
MDPPNTVSPPVLPTFKVAGALVVTTPAPVSEPIVTVPPPRARRPAFATVPRLPPSKFKLAVPPERRARVAAPDVAVPIVSVAALTV